MLMRLSILKAARARGRRGDDAGLERMKVDLVKLLRRGWDMAVREPCAIYGKER
jgi:hypothetical protein